MAQRFSVGDFSRATHLTVKTLRHYHEVGLLEPGLVEPSTNYRYYFASQIPQAQVIKRLRDLEMPVVEIKAVLAAKDTAGRNALIAKHLDRLEVELARTRAAVSSLRSILAGPAPGLPVSRRTVAATPAMAIRAIVEHDNVVAWWHGALGELRATARAARLEPTGAIGGLFAGEVFQEDRGSATVFIPLAGPVKPIGRIESIVIPAVELAIVTHVGSHDDIDVAYGELGAYVAGHEIGVDGPIREYYLRDPVAHPDPAEWLTEIAWPIFRADCG